jgi:Flp pilus assembly protein TadG
MTNIKRKFSIRSERGQTMTEFAIVLPLLAVLLFGIIQLGIAFNNYMTVTDATRAGARKAAVSRDLEDPRSAAETAVRSSASTLSQDDLDVDVQSNFEPGSDVTVTASYPYSISLPLIGLVVTDGQLTSSTTERVE